MQFNSDTIWEKVYMAIIIAFERKRRELKKMDPKGNGGRVSKMCVWKSATYHGVEEAARGSLEEEEPKLNQTVLLVHLTLHFGCWRLNSCPAASSTTQPNPRLRLPALRSSGVLVLSQAHLCLLPSPRLAAMPFTTVRWHQGRTATGSYFTLFLDNGKNNLHLRWAAERLLSHEMD